MAQNHSRAGAYLLHPAVWLSIALLLVNDHVLKAAFPGWVTGKLSDVAGLVFFPLIVAGVIDLGAHWLGRDLGEGQRRRLVLGACLLTASFFAAIQLFDWADACFRHALGALQWPFYAVRAGLAGEPTPGVSAVDHTADPTDLLALLALAVPLWITRRQEARESGRAPARRCPDDDSRAGRPR